MTRDQPHPSASTIADQSVVGLLVALGGMYLEAGKLDPAESVLRRAVEIIEAGGYASDHDVVTMHRRLAHLHHARGDDNAAQEFGEREIGGAGEFDADTVRSLGVAVGRGRWRTQTDVATAPHMKLDTQRLEEERAKPANHLAEVAIIIGQFNDANQRRYAPAKAQLPPDSYPLQCRSVSAT